MEKEVSLMLNEGKRLVAAFSSIDDKDPFSGMSLIKENYALIFSGPEGNETAKFENVSLEFKVLVDYLLSNDTTLFCRRKDNAEVLFATNDIKKLISEYSFRSVDLYMSKENYYRIGKVLRRKYRQYDVLTASFTSEGGNEFTLNVLFGKGDGPYLARLNNFLELLNGAVVKPKSNISPVFNSEHLNQLFKAFGHGEPRFKKACAYKLESVFTQGNDVYLQYIDMDTHVDYLTRITSYSDDSDVPFERKVSSVYNFFNRYTGKYFVSAEDLWDCELDFMKVPSAEEPFIFRFSGSIEQNELKEDLYMMKRDAERSSANWNEVRYNSFFSTGKRYIPDRIL
ncbi:MAG: hypothetical protein ACP5RF_03390 [Candidatus Micrarchaeia archaeon]